MVEEGEVDRLFLKNLQSLLAIGDGEDPVSLVDQKPAEHFPLYGIIVHDEDFHREPVLPFHAELTRCPV